MKINFYNSYIFQKGCLLFFATLFLAVFHLNPAHGSVKAVYVGGDFYPPITTGTVAENSGFNTLCLFTLHIYTNGDVYYNDTPVVQSGIYVGATNWGTSLAVLKPAINRTELVVGGAGDASFANIENLIASQGTGTNSVLYKDFQALKNATGANAIQYDDEQTYDVSSSVAFGNMIAGLGLKVTLCPYTDQSYWVGVQSQLGTNVDAIYLQCYSGGAGNVNDVGSWDSAFGGFKVYPGLWGNTSDPPAVTSQMQNWVQSLGITGGFMWLNGGLPFDALKWGQALAFGLDPLNGLIAEDAATNYAATGFTGNEGFGLSAWTINAAGGGSYISGDNPAIFGIWNNTANGQSTATRSFNTPLQPGQPLLVQLQFNTLDNSSNTNAFQLLDASGNVLFSYYHVGGDSANGHYTDATGNHAATGFAYDYSKAGTFTFTLNSSTTYTFIDNSADASVSGTLSGAVVSQVNFLRVNGNSAPSNGQDFKFNDLVVYTPTNLPVALTSTNSNWQINFSATPSLTYRVQRATNLNGPWANIGSIAAWFNSCEFNDTNSPAGQFFYRTATP